MGKGTKHASDWKMTTLKVAIDARRLYCHSVKIMSNEKVFKPSNDFRGATLMTIHELLLDVYIKTWEANRINAVRHPESAAERLALQRAAMASCHRLLALFELVKSQFHIESGKFWNWMNMLYDVGNEIAAAMFRRGCDEWTSARVIETLDRQYAGDNGYNPGSQMVQIAGISYLSGVDHFIKERLRAKMYVRYMDDFHIVERDAATLAIYREEISAKMSEIGMMLHPDKTMIVSAAKGVTFLGFHYCVTESGKVLKFRDRKRVKEIRRRMVRLSHRIERGETRREALAESYQCVRSMLVKGNSARLLRRMDAFYKNLEMEIDNEGRCRKAA